MIDLYGIKLSYSSGKIKIFCIYKSMKFEHASILSSLKEGDICL